MYRYRLNFTQKNISLPQGCITFLDSYRFKSSSLPSFIKTLVHIRYATLKKSKEQISEDDDIGKTNQSRRDDILNFVNERETLIGKSKYDNDSIGDIKKSFNIWNWKIRRHFKDF